MNEKINLDTVKKPAGMVMSDEKFRAEVKKMVNNLSIRCTPEEATLFLFCAEKTGMKKATLTKRCLSLGLPLVLKEAYEGLKSGLEQFNAMLPDADGAMDTLKKHHESAQDKSRRTPR